jgi:hypothetical protein
MMCGGPGDYTAIATFQLDRKTLIAGGRLIAHSPDSNLACGMSEVETKGYLHCQSSTELRLSSLKAAKARVGNG